MSALNPYDKFLDGRPLDEILASTADALAEYLDRIGPRKVTTPPAPGKWSAAEIVCHLADCDLVFGFRLRQTLAEDGPDHPALRSGQMGGDIRRRSAARRLRHSPRCANGICG